MSEGPERDVPHVMFVLSGLTMGGAESQLTSLVEAEAPAAARWRVTVLTLTRARHPELAQRLERRGVRLVLVDRQAASFPRFFARLVRAMRAARPDVVHTLLSGSSGTWGRFAARLAGVPCVAHSDRSLEPVRTRLQAALEPWANRVTDAFFTNADAIAQRLAASGVPARRIAVVPNGVDLGRFAAADGAALRREWGVGATGLVVGYLGMLRPEKRPQLLLDALERMPEAERPARVVYAGDGALRAVGLLLRTLPPDVGQELLAHLVHAALDELLGLLLDLGDALFGVVDLRFSAQPVVVGVGVAPQRRRRGRDPTSRPPDPSSRRASGSPGA